MDTLGLPKFLILKALIMFFTHRCPKQKADGILGRLVLSLRVQLLTPLQNPFKAPFGTHPIKYIKKKESLLKTVTFILQLLFNIISHKMIKLGENFSLYAYTIAIIIINLHKFD